MGTESNERKFDLIQFKNLGLWNGPFEEVGFTKPPLKKANRLKDRDAKPRDYELTTPTALVSRATKGERKRRTKVVLE